MWKRKSQEEIAAEKKARWWKRFSPVVPALSAAAASVFWFVYRITFGGHWRSPGDSRPRSVVEALAEMPVALIVFFLFVYILQTLWGSFENQRAAVICSNCSAVKEPDSKVDCKCGGRFEPLENWHWVEDDDEDSSQDTEADA